MHGGPNLSSLPEVHVCVQIGTSRLIWAYNAEDPDSPDSLKFHEQNKGWRSVNLLDGRATDVPMPDDVMHVDAKMDNVRTVEVTFQR